ISKPGHIQFRLIENNRTPTTPKSMALGHDSFKGMSIDWGDLRGTGRLDGFVSDITVSWGIEESNLLWLNTSKDDADAKATFDKGRAPFVQRAAQYRVAWTGWGWDAKMGDFDNSGHLAIVQTDGFVKGKIDRWPWLQELAMANDQLIKNPRMWPRAEAGDEIAGHEPLAFYAPSDGGRYVLNHQPCPQHRRADPGPGRRHRGPHGRRAQGPGDRPPVGAAGVLPQRPPRQRQLRRTAVVPAGPGQHDRRAGAARNRGLRRRGQVHHRRRQGLPDQG